MPSSPSKIPTSSTPAAGSPLSALQNGATSMKRREACYSAVVIGAGGIAGGYDSPGNPLVLTHLHALSCEPRFVCRGLFDIDFDRAKSQAARWQVPAAADLTEALSGPVDLVVIAVPDDFHAEYLERLLTLPVGIVLCEKPLTPDLALTESLLRRYAAAGRPLLVNYQRRYERTVLALKKEIEAGTIGRPLGGAVWYSKGILHNGSHAVDLLRFFFGDVRAAIARRRVADFTRSDPSVGGTLRFADLDVELIVGDERQFSLFEIDLLFEHARVRYSQSGMRIERFEVLPDPVFPGYRELQTVASGETGLGHAMRHVYRLIADVLDGRAEPPGDVRDAFAAQRVCQALAVGEADRWITLI